MNAKLETDSSYNKSRPLMDSGSFKVLQNRKALGHSVSCAYRGLQCRNLSGCDKIHYLVLIVTIGRAMGFETGEL